MKNKNHQSKHKTEDAARAAARLLGQRYCFIIKSPEGGFADLTKPGCVPCFWLEAGKNANGFIRTWEQLVYSGPGCEA